MTAQHDATTLAVLYRDARFIAVDKPSGLLTTRGDDGSDSLTDRVRLELAPNAEVVHPLSRLDYEVSGVVLFALDYEATGRAASARATAKYHREYHAIVSPAPAFDEAEWRWSIGVDPRNPSRRVAAGGREQESAHTVARVMERRSSTAWLELTPMTGRTHQLRVHCAKAGAAVVGDRTYRGARRLTLDDGAVLAVSRVMLHCARVSLGGDIVVSSPWPEDFAALWRALK
jgi:23S rRNA-/tRNA-specific pseudouridylate synthase